MRVALVGRYVNRQGGVSRVLVELADRIAVTQDVTIITHEALDVDPASQARIVEVPMRRKPSWGETPSFARHAARAIEAGNFDVVHTQDGQCRRTHITTAQSCYVAWLDSARTGAGARGLASRIFPRHVYTARWERGTFRAPEPMVIAISHAIADELQRFHDVDPSRIRVVHNGVDTAGFAPPTSKAAARRALPAVSRPADTDTVLLFVGHYFQRKGLHTLIAALGGLRDRSWHLQVAGGDDATPFRAMAADAGITDRMDFLGHQPRVAAYMQAADAFVFPTSYEPFGLVITEALACGTPTITSAGAGGAELMRDGQDGFLLQNPQDVDELRGAIVRFLDLDPHARAQMSAAARQSAESTDWAHQAARHVELYTQVAENLRAGRPAWAT